MRYLAWFREHPKYLEVACVVTLFLTAFIFRIYSTARYDFTEDEIFALEFNQVHTLPELITAPDFDHPPLWYIVMDPIVSLGATPFELRFIQILIFSTALCISFRLLEDYPLKYRFLPLLWLALNPYIIHLTAGYLMYASVLALTLISFSWILRILHRHEFLHLQPSTNQTIALSMFMALGLLTDYSFFWFSCFLLVFFGISWLQYKQNFWLKMLGSVVLSGLFDIWFLPIFVKNLFLTAQAHQWAPAIGIQSFIQLVTDLFGLVNRYEFNLNWLFFYGLIFLLVLFILSWIHKAAWKKKPLFDFIPNQWLAFGGMTAIFLLVCALFPNSFFYARVCLTFIIPLTFLIIFAIFSHIKGNHFSMMIGLIFIIFTSLSLYIYYQPTNQYIWDYQQHPLKRLLSSYTFPSQSCVFVVPAWIYSDVVFNLPQNATVHVVNPRVTENLTSCQYYFYIDQTTILAAPRNDSLQKIRETYRGVCKVANSKLIQDNEELYQCK